MRKRILAAVCLTLTLAFTGCGQTPAASFSENDLTLTVSGHVYQCRNNMETVLADLGDGYEYAEGKSCNYDGLDKTYAFPEATFYTNPLPEGDLLNEIHTESTDAATSKGISVGAQKADVLAAYGAPVQQDAAILIYRMSEETGQPSLCFELEGETVTAIFLTLEQV